MNSEDCEMSNEYCGSQVIIKINVLQKTLDNILTNIISDNKTEKDVIVSTLDNLEEEIYALRRCYTNCAAA